MNGVEDSLQYLNAKLAPSLLSSAATAGTPFWQSASLFGDNYKPGFALLIGAAMTVITCIPTIIIERQCRWQRRQRQQAAESSSASSISSSGRDGGAVPPPPSLKRKAELYRLLFNESGNRLTMEDRHVIAIADDEPESSTDIESGGEKEGKEGKEGGSKDYEEPFVDIELGVNDSPSTHLSIQAERNSKVDETKNKQNGQSRTFGSCIICFEEFLAGDGIVWSEDETCPHVFHEECMAQYLATNTRRNKRGRRAAEDASAVVPNPCPVCRRNFCAPVAKDPEVEEAESIE